VLRADAAAFVNHVAGQPALPGGPLTGK